MEIVEGQSQEVIRSDMLPVAFYQSFEFIEKLKTINNTETKSTILLIHLLDKTNLLLLYSNSVYGDCLTFYVFFILDNCNKFEIFKFILQIFFYNTL